jgi:hypothetical protein
MTNDAEIDQAIAILDDAIRNVHRLYHEELSQFRSAAVSSWVLMVGERLLTHNNIMADDVFPISPEGQPAYLSEQLVKYGAARFSGVVQQELAAQFMLAAMEDEGGDDE